MRSVRSVRSRTCWERDFREDADRYEPVDDGRNGSNRVRRLGVTTRNGISRSPEILINVYAFDGGGSIRGSRK